MRPLFDDDKEVIGTQLDFMMANNPEENLKIFNFRNFENEDYQY